MVTDLFNKLVSSVLFHRSFLYPLNTLLPHPPLPFAHADTTSFSHRTCHSKCINTRYAEADLNKGESVCIDRCVGKYFEVNKKVGEKLQAVGANAQAAGNTGGSSGGFGGF